jgi:hypothetical protein
MQAFVFLSPWPAGDAYHPARAKLALFVLGNFTYVIAALICAAFLVARWRVPGEATDRSVGG